MDIREIESFKLSDAVKFHDDLNPALWTNKGELDPEVYDKLIEIAKDFIAELGLSSLKVDDITISGSNAAYSYTPHSDLDLHILVNYNKLPDNEVYKELFNAKKTVYNDQHDIKVHGVPVELYVQDSNQIHTSLGEYSLLKKEWNKFPVKGRANFDQASTKLKYEKLGNLIELALKSKKLDDVNRVLDIIKRYRKAGLEKTGEFGPENLSFKAIRKQGLFQKLFDLKQKLRSKELSIEDYDPNGLPPGPEFKPTMPKGTVRVDVSDVYDWYKLGQNISNLDKVDKKIFGKGPPSTIVSFGDEDTEHKYIKALQNLGLDTTDIDPKAHDVKTGQKVDPTYNVNEILDPKSASEIEWKHEGEQGTYSSATALAKDKNNNKLKYEFFYFPRFDLTNIEFTRAVGPWGNNYEIDKAGDQYTVFATLMEAIRQYLSEGKPNFILFSAKEPSRVRLYKTFVNRFASQFGYKPIGPEHIPDVVRAILVSSRDTPFLLAKSELVQESVKFIEGTNCKNCVWWKKDSEKPVGKDELNKYGGLKPPNKGYIAMSKRVDLVTLPGKDTVKEKGFCYHKDINDWVTERMCCAKWDGKGVLRDYKGESPLMESKAEAVRKIQKFLNNKYDANLDVDGVLGPLTLQSINKFMPKAKKTGAPQPDKTTAVQGKAVKEASGYIPSKKEKNDPVLALIDKARDQIGEDVLYGGNCGMFALALATKLKEQGITVTLGLLFNDANNLGKPSDIVENEADLYHVVVEYNGKYYDGTGIVTPDTLLNIAYDQYGDDSPGWFTEANPFDKKIEQVIRSETNWSKTAASFYDVLAEASGYIPSKKQAKDPRYSSALTVDVKPDSIKKNASAFSFNISREGIPPTAKTNGRIK